MLSSLRRIMIIVLTSLGHRERENKRRDVRFITQFIAMKRDDDALNSNTLTERTTIIKLRAKKFRETIIAEIF